MKTKDKKGSINLELDENLAQGTYSNLALINHSISEFVVDFINVMPGVPKAKVKSRIILTPQVGESLRNIKMVATQKFSKPPFRFNEA